MFSLHASHLHPLQHPCTTGIFCPFSDVEMVMVNGTVLMEKGALTTIDEERILFETGKDFLRLVS